MTASDMTAPTGILSHALAGRKFRGTSEFFLDFILRFAIHNDLIRESVWTMTFFLHFCATFRSRDLVCVFMKSDIPGGRHGVVTPMELIAPSLPVHGIQRYHRRDC